MKNPLSVLLVCAAASLTACETAMQLHEANEQLTSSYFVMQQAAGDPLLEETATASMRDLGRTAAERAQAAQDPRNKISFYRIAATAAWQAKDDEVLTYSAAGSAVCEDNWNDAPRDCGMLTFIDDLAGVDETTRNLDETAVNDIAKVEQYFDDYESLAITMIENRERLVDSVPGSLLVEYDERIDELICRNIAFRAIGRLGQAGSTVDGACRLGNLRLRAQQASVNLMTCPGPVPAAEQNCN